WIEKGARHSDGVRRHAGRRAERGVRHVTDVAVAPRLHPDPAFRLVEYLDVVAKEQLRVEPGVRARLAAHVGDMGGNCGQTAGDVAFRLYLPLQPCVGEVGPEGMEAAVEDSHSGSSAALAMIASPKRST